MHAEALTSLESAANAALARSGTEISIQDVENAINIVAINYDKDGDTHYDVISAFIKSIRGSDPDASLHYLARMLHAGEDPRFVARRLMILASEDIGLASSQVLLTVLRPAQSVALVGMPEAQIILAHATLEATLAPKSNSVVAGIGAAMADVQREGLAASRFICAMRTTRVLRTLVTGPSTPIPTMKLAALPSSPTSRRTCSPRSTTSRRVLALRSDYEQSLIGFANFVPASR